MRDVFKGKVSRRPGPSGPGAAALDRDFWRSAGAGAPSAVFLFATAALTEQAQKALKEDDLPKDGPFKLEGHGFAERKRFVLTIGFALIEAATGETLWTTEVKETRISNEILEAPEFALAELLPAVRVRLFLMLFGRSAADRRDFPALTKGPPACPRPEPLLGRYSRLAEAPPGTGNLPKKRPIRVPRLPLLHVRPRGKKRLETRGVKCYDGRAFPAPTSVGRGFSTDVEKSVEKMMASMEPEEKQNPWNQILKAVEEKVDPNSFETWFEPTSSSARTRSAFTSRSRIPTSATGCRSTIRT